MTTLVRSWRHSRQEALSMGATAAGSAGEVSGHGGPTAGDWWAVLRLDFGDHPAQACIRNACPLVAIPRLHNGLHNKRPGMLIAQLGVISRIFDHNVPHLGVLHSPRRAIVWF